MESPRVLLGSTVLQLPPRQPALGFGGEGGKRRDGKPCGDSCLAFCAAWLHCAGRRERVAASEMEAI